jgi:hypothetical protein
MLLTASIALAITGPSYALSTGAAAIVRQDGALLKAGFCPHDGRPCADNGPPDYDKPAIRRPDRTVYVAPPAPLQAAACEEEDRVRRAYAPPPYDGRGYDEWCGIRCWYHRLRAGYCGRGCDYYRFRMFEFPEGPLSRYHGARVACRTGP